MVPETADQLLEQFVRDGWDSKPFDGMLALAARGDGELLRLVTQAISTLPKSATFLDAAVSLLAAADLRAVADRAVRYLREHPEAVSGSSVAEGLIAELSLQAPQVLSGSLRTLWTLAPNRRAYYAEWPWRACPDEEVGRLLAVLAGGPQEDRGRAWEALMQSRRQDALLVALGAPAGQRVSDADAEQLPEVGLAFRKGHLQRLYPDGCYHLVFPLAVLDALSTGPSWTQPRNHPTWTEATDPAGQVVVGGVSQGTCGTCSQRLHRLLAFLDGIPDDLGVSGLGQLEIAGCVSCVFGSGPQFFQHGSDGVPHPLTRQAQPTPAEWTSEPILEATCTLARTADRWRQQDWATSNGRQNLHRVGGEPTWIQSAEYSECPGCATTMHALMQLDSLLPTTDGGELYWGSGGIGYVLWCDACSVSAVTMQCT